MSSARVKMGLVMEGWSCELIDVAWMDRCGAMISYARAKDPAPSKPEIELRPNRCCSPFVGNNHGDELDFFYLYGRPGFRVKGLFPPAPSKYLRYWAFVLEGECS